MEGKHRSDLSNFTYTLDGIATIDKVFMDKAMKRASIRYLDITIPTKEMVNKKMFESSPSLSYNLLLPGNT